MEVYQEGEEVMTLPCFHQFHTRCITVWLRDTVVCPICRHPADHLEIQELDDGTNEDGDQRNDGNGNGNGGGGGGGNDIQNFDLNGDNQDDDGGMEPIVL